MQKIKTSVDDVVLEWVTRRKKADFAIWNKQLRATKPRNWDEKKMKERNKNITISRVCDDDDDDQVMMNRMKLFSLSSSPNLKS